MAGIPWYSTTLRDFVSSFFWLQIPKVTTTNCKAAMEFVQVKDDTRKVTQEASFTKVGIL